MNAAERPQKKCPYCAETINAEAIKCRYCGSWLDKRRFLEDWTRPRKGRQFVGVCAGIARQMAIPVTLVRIAFVLLTVIGGYGVLLYLALWLLMPWEPKPDKAPPSAVSVTLRPPPAEPADAPDPEQQG